MHEFAPRAFHDQTDVLVIGSGFAGLSCFRGIDRRKRAVKLVSKRNHFLFTPLLTMAATGAVGSQSIIEPVRTFQQSEEEILMGEAVDLDPEQNRVRLRLEDEEEGWIGYQTLVLAVGADPNTYGIPGVGEHCFFFKEMKHAHALREHILWQFEKAVRLSGNQRKSALRFVVVGAGATGVELACSMHDLIYRDLKFEFPNEIAEAEIIILEATQHILPPFDQKLTDYAKKKLEQKKIRVRTEAPVQEIERHRIHLPEEASIDSETIVWAGGIGPGPNLRAFADRLDVELKKGKLPVNATLQVQCDHPNVFALGDCALFEDQNGRPLPATAQLALKEGKHLAAQLNRNTLEPFRGRSIGMLAYLGSGAAIARVKKVKFHGLLAWWFWKLAYLNRLVSWRNKTTVLFEWMKLRFFGRNTSTVETESTGGVRPRSRPSASVNLNTSLD